MALTITPDDLEPFAEIDVGKAVAMIDDALAMAAMVAPCILEDDFAQDGAAKAIIRGAILRWNDAGTGAYQQKSVGSVQVSMDTRTERRSMFWPSEITQLQRLCETSRSGAFTIDTTPPAAGPRRWVSTAEWETP